MFTEREQETVLEGEPIGSKVTQVNAIDKDGTHPNNQVSETRFLTRKYIVYLFRYWIILEANVCRCNFISQVTYYVVESERNEGKDYFEIKHDTGEIFTKVVFDREKQGAYALEVEARDGAASARPNSDGKPNSGK